MEGLSQRLDELCTRYVRAVTENNGYTDVEREVIALVAKCLQEEEQAREYGFRKNSTVLDDFQRHYAGPLCATVWDVQHAQHLRRRCDDSIRAIFEGATFRHRYSRHSADFYLEG